MATSYLVVSDREPLACPLRTESFAIPAARARLAPALGDTVLLVTTRGCYGNPTRDRGLVIGVGRVTSEPRALPEPVSFGDREFRIGLSLDLIGARPVHEGVELGRAPR